MAIFVFETYAQASELVMYGLLVFVFVLVFVSNLKHRRTISKIAGNRPLSQLSLDELNELVRELPDSHHISRAAIKEARRRAQLRDPN